MIIFFFKGEIQSRNFYELSSGLCAIVCYYDARRYYCMLLKSLLAFNSVNSSMSSESFEKVRNLINTILSDKNIFFELIGKFNFFFLKFICNCF